MKALRILVALFFLPLALYAQEIQDTIPAGDGTRKASGNFIYETTVDTAITIVINEILAKNSDFNTDNSGDNDDWFEIYNYGDDPVKLNKLWFTDNPSEPFKWKLDTTSEIFLEPDAYYLIWADEEPDEGLNHATFKLDGDGEYLAIHYSDSSMIDEISYKDQSSNISFGRYPDGATTWNFFNVPSPKAENNSSGGASILPPPIATIAGGFYSEPIFVTLHSGIDDAEIRYNLNASNPGKRSILYQNPILIDTTTILRATVVKDGYIDSQVLTMSYLFGSEEPTNPVISIVSDPENLYGENGLISTNSKTLEIPANFEYIIDSKTVFESGTGIQLHSVKNYIPNSMRFYARSRYGNEWFEYPFFKETEPLLYKRLILRNGGNDNVNKAETNTHFRDPLASEISKSSNTYPITSASQPVNVYLNGKYYGLFNLRERIDKYYIETHTGETENYDLLERAFGYGKNRHAIHGSFENYDALLAFVDTIADLNKDIDFQYVASEVDIENFTDYWITEVFLGNYDWLSNNVKFWKSDEGKWQWIYWDLDHAIGLDFLDYGNTDWNTLEWSLSFGERAWPNGFNNILIRNLLKNQSYKEYFIKRFTQLLNTRFSFANTEIIYNSMVDLYKDDMLIHADRWGNDYKDWLSACEIMKEYLENRPQEQLEHLRSYFNLPEPVSVKINLIPHGAGSITIDENEIKTSVFNGKFFPGMEFNTTIKSIPGYRLNGLKINGVDSMLNKLVIEDSMQIDIGFIPEDALIPIQITEIYVNNKSKFDCGDWIEIYHYGIDTLDASGIELLENNQVLYKFKEGSKLPPDQYFVLTENKEDFKKVYPDSIFNYGDLLSGISNKFDLRLQSSSGIIYNKLEYSTESWPKIPIKGYSFELNNLTLNAEDAANWKISKNTFGSPGHPNEFQYSFSLPLGRDTLFSNSKIDTIRFLSSADYYSDLDGHQLAEIYVSHIEGPGKISSNRTAVVSDSYHEPSDFIFKPMSPYNEPTNIFYRFIDYSGQMSLEYKILFNNANLITYPNKASFTYYPSPARDQLIIELPKEIQGKFNFKMFDISGKLVQIYDNINYGNSVQIQLNKVQPGLYFFRFTIDKQMYNGKIEVIE